MSITYEVLYWGHIVAYWQVDADGTGEFWRISSDNIYAAPTIRKFKVHLQPDFLTRFEHDSGLLAKAARHHSRRCPPLPIDGPGGFVSWTDKTKHEIQRFNLNECLATDFDRIADQALKRMTDIVTNHSNLVPLDQPNSAASAHP